MPPRTRAILFDMQHSALGIAEFVDGKTFQDYLSDPMLRAAVERMFEIIGEALTRLCKADPALADRISDAHRIIGFRNVLIHGYDQIDSTKTWQIIHEKLPLLREELDELLKSAK